MGPLTNSSPFCLIEEGRCYSGDNIVNHPLWRGLICLLGVECCRNLEYTQSSPLEALKLKGLEVIIE